LFSFLKIILRLLFVCPAVFLWSPAVSCGFQAYREDGTPHRATERHLPYGITQCLMPPDRG